MYKIYKRCIKKQKQKSTIGYIPHVLVLHEGGFHHLSAPSVLLSSLSSSSVDKKVSYTPGSDAEETSTHTSINKLDRFTDNSKLETECNYNIRCPLRQEQKRDF